MQEKRLRCALKLQLMQGWEGGGGTILAKKKHLLSLSALSSRWPQVMEHYRDKGGKSNQAKAKKGKLYAKDNGIIYF